MELIKKGSLKFPVIWKLNFNSNIQYLVKLPVFKLGNTPILRKERRVILLSM